MTTPQPEVLAARLQRFGLARDRLRAQLARRAGISETDLDALEHLEAEGPLTQKDLGNRLSITSGAVTMLVDRLEATGWVRRGPHPTDRRCIVLELTSRAEQDQPAGLVRFHDRIRAIARSVPAEHREVVAAFLDAAAEAAASAAADLGQQSLK
jgi:DNA-binding MarR family transcriptional regulator